MKEFPKRIFKAYDIRGLLEEVSPEIAGQVGRAAVAKLGGKTVLVGRDMRATSPDLAKAAIEGVMAMGGRVVDIGLTTTSMFNWAVTSQGVDIGIMITASHNPAEYNGMKLADSTGQPISGEELYDFVIETFEDAADAGDVEVRDLRDAYLDAVLAAAGELPDFSGTKLVVDYGNGMGSYTVKPLLARLGIDVIELYPELDARFPNHEANPAKEETLVDAKNALEVNKADFAVATDGDGDRIGFIDNEGHTLRGDQSLALLAKQMLANHPGAKIVVAPNHGWAATDFMKELGADLVEERIGRTFVIRKMHETGALLGGEISSHFFYKEFYNLESIDYTLLLILKIWKDSGQSLADIVRPLRTYVNSGEINNEIKNKEEVLDRIQSTYAETATVVDRTDGIRCEFGRDWWFIVRPSNTEPLIRLTVEAKSVDVMNEKIKEIESLIV